MREVIATINLLALIKLDVVSYGSNGLFLFDLSTQMNLNDIASQWWFENFPIKRTMLYLFSKSS